MATEKRRMHYLNAQGELVQVLPETSAEQVKISAVTGLSGISNVQDAIEEIAGVASSSGVTGIKLGGDDAETSKGTVVVSPDTIGAQPAFSDGSATIATKTGDVVTLKTSMSQTGGAVSNGAGADITLNKIAVTGKYTDLSGAPTLGDAASKGVSTSIAATGSDDKLATEKAVRDAINSLPEPMVFKGSIGTSGTIAWSALPTASTSTGHAYKVISDHNSAPVCKVGDLIISNGTTWVVIPSGDEPSGTVTSVGLSMPTGFSVSSSPITTSGTISVSLASGYSMVTSTEKQSWNGKQAQNAKLDSIAALGNGAGFLKFNNGTASLETISIPEGSITLTGDVTATGTTGSSVTTTIANNAITTDKINSKAVTAAKIADKTISGDKIADGAVSNDKLTESFAGAQSTKVYSAFTTTTKGRIVDAGTAIEFGVAGQQAPSDDLMLGGLFFELQE